MRVKMKILNLKRNPKIFSDVYAPIGPRYATPLPGGNGNRPGPVARGSSVISAPRDRDLYFFRPAMVLTCT